MKSVPLNCYSTSLAVQTQRFLYHFIWFKGGQYVYVMVGSTFKKVPKNWPIFYTSNEFRIFVLNIFETTPTLTSLNVTTIEFETILSSTWYHYKPNNLVLPTFIMCIFFMYILYYMFLLSQMTRIHFYCFGCNTCPSAYLNNFGPIYVNAPLFVLF